MAGSSSLTPMFRQYRDLKAAHPNAVLLFRMGDFYEMFYEDAQKASRVLDLALTARGKGTAHVAPMCGFPHHQLDAYTARLVRAGLRAAICEQVEDPRKAKGLVRREVVRIVTPGTLTDPEHLESKENSWIAGVAWIDRRAGAAFLDASTGEFLAWQAPEDGDPWDALADRLEAFSPREIAHPEEFPWSERFRRERTAGAVLTGFDPYAFAPNTAAESLARHLSVASLDGFGLRERPAAVGAAGGLLSYLLDTQKCGLEHIDGITVHEPTRFVLIDPSTRRNLELERSLRDGGRDHTLLGAVDSTVTSAGARQIRRWLLAPLLDPSAIATRLDAVQAFHADAGRRLDTRDRLKHVHDIERLLGRIVAGSANARDLLALRLSLERLPELLGSLAEMRAPLLRETLDALDPCEDVAATLARAIVDDPPVSLREGGFVRDGFHAELDELRTVRRDGRTYIASLESREREATGIGTLKVRFNKVFGYYIEVSKSNLRLVPSHYHRKQTIATGERFITPELKEYESKVLRAQERIEALEKTIFAELRSEVASHAQRLKACARAVALVDVVSALAESAANQGWCRPKIHEGFGLRIAGGRHPVVERTLVDERFVSNDTDLDPPHRAIAVLTGPNMGGKSTYLRQVALIALLAQSGSFVPADEVEVGIVDRIFCRVGASDSLAEGQSTFMVEMSETANILRHATSRSLLLLDEIGRGTSTFDGLAIAWAVVEHLDSRGGGPPRTLFATHYHELTELAVTLSSVVNLRMAVRESGERVVFLHRVEPGAADRSYGIHVARLAGLPREVIHRSSEILANLERDEFGADGLPRRARRRSSADGGRQATLFGSARPSSEAEDPAISEILAELRRADPDRLTPIEALRLLESWRRRIEDDPRPSD